MKLWLCVGSIFVIARRAKWTLEIYVAATRVATRAGDEVMNALLRYRALMDVVVSREDGIYTVAHK